VGASSFPYSADLTDFFINAPSLVFGLLLARRPQDDFVDRTFLECSKSRRQRMKQFLSPLAVIVACVTLPHLAIAQTSISPSVSTPDKVETRIGPLEF
jgi:hypothetical protein